MIRWGAIPKSTGDMGLWCGSTISATSRHYHDMTEIYNESDFKLKYTHTRTRTHTHTHTHTHSHPTKGQVGDTSLAHVCQ